MTAEESAAYQPGDRVIAALSGAEDGPLLARGVVVSGPEAVGRFPATYGVLLDGGGEHLWTFTPRALLPEAAALSAPLEVDRG